MLSLILREASTIPIEVDGLIPERLSQLTLEQIQSLSVARGNRTVKVRDVFSIMVSPNSVGELHFTGPTACLKRIGERMTTGTIVVHGDTGMHAGAYLAGGKVVIKGNAGDWLGAEMASGTIEVKGNAGHLAGAGYRGCRRGMTGGQIHIRGSAGDEVGAHIRRGMIIVGGAVGRFVGVNMIAGTIVANTVGPQAGVGMKRGTIVVNHGELDRHPGIAFAGEMRPAYLGLLDRHLMELGINQPIRPNSARLFRSDRNVGGQGEIWMRNF